MTCSPYKIISNKSAGSDVGCFVEFPLCFLKRGNMSYTFVSWNDSFYDEECEKLAEKFKRIAIEGVFPHAPISPSIYR